MTTFSFNPIRRRLSCLLVWSGLFFGLLTYATPAQAAAPVRAKPYTESICNTDPNVFFCEDFEGQDLVNYGSNNCNSSWGNPAISQKDICWAGGGSHQRSTAALTGFNQTTNRVWRVSKTQSFTDINTGINTGTGPGTIAGWLNPAILGAGSQEWYARIQVWFSPDHTWPADYDFKMFFALPRQFIDHPSAAYETGMYFHQDFWCSGSGNYKDVPVIRYSSNFRQFPYQNEYCPPLSPGQSPDGAHAPRIKTGKWYTLEYHVKLSPTSNGILEMWVDGVKTYTTNRLTCHSGCNDMGYIMIMGWMNPADQQSGYYEIDNIVMSRSYIGLPAATSPPSLTLPAAPTSLSIK